MEKCVIYGVSGQDGSYLSEFLLEKSHEVIGVARRCSHDYTERIRGILDNPRFTLVESDVTDFSSILNIIDKYRPDHIYNLAAMSHVHTSFNQPLFTFDVTGKGVLNILEAIRFLDYGPKFYQASSSEIFGDQYTLSHDLQKVQYEETKMNPQSPYGVAKLLGYCLTQLYRKSYGIFAVNGILFNHESPRRGEIFVTKKITKYIGRLYHSGFSKDFPKLKLGNIYSFRDFGYAPDYVEAMYLMMQHKKPDDFVIATGESHSVEEFLNESFGHIDKDWHEYVEIDESLKRPSEVPYLKGCAEKAKRILGWKPKVMFKELVEKMVRYEIDH